MNSFIKGNASTGCPPPFAPLEALPAISTERGHQRGTCAQRPRRRLCRRLVPAIPQPIGTQGRRRLLRSSATAPQGCRTEARAGHPHTPIGPAGPPEARVGHPRVSRGSVGVSRGTQVRHRGTIRLFLFLSLTHTHWFSQKKSKLTLKKFLQ